MADEIFEDEIDDYLRRLDDDFFEAATHLREPFQQAEAHASGGMAEHILTARSPGGDSYPPLAPSTIAGRKNKGRIGSGVDGGLAVGNVRPLIETGALIQSLHGGSGHVADIEDEYFTAGTDIEYAGFQNDGTSRIPAREFAGWTPNAIDKTVDIVADHCVTKLKG